MDYSQVVDNLSPEIIEKLTTAIEIGRWESGEKLTSEQIESAMQAVMVWQAKHIDNSDSEPFIVGPKGELFTGKGEAHKVAQAPKFDEDNLIAKHKV